MTSSWQDGHLKDPHKAYSLGLDSPEYMKTPRRELLAGGLALLAGCTRLTGSEEPENTTLPPKDYSLDDLHIYNGRDRTVAVTLALVPEGETEPSMELAVRVPAEDSIIWADNPLLDDPGQVTATVDDGTGESEREETDWHGDSIDDNRRLVVLVEDDGISIEQHGA